MHEHSFGYTTPLRSAYGALIWWLHKKNQENRAPYEELNPSLQHGKLAPILSATLTVEKRHKIRVTVEQKNTATVGACYHIVNMLARPKCGALGLQRLAMHLAAEVMKPNGCTVTLLSASCNESWMKYVCCGNGFRTYFLPRCLLHSP